MSAYLNPDQVERIIKSLLGVNTTCILGAGASVQRVAIGSNMTESVSKKVFDNTDFITPGRHLIAGVARNWLYNPNFIGSLFEDGVLNQLSTQTLEIYEHQASIPSSYTCPSSYEIFKLIPNRLTLLNYNVDKLATIHCGRKHTVREMHGTNDPFFPRTLSLKQVHEITSNGYRMTPIGNRGYFSAEKVEEFSIYWNYWWAESLIGCSDLLTIGYSFAFNATTNSLNDWFSFEKIRTFLRDSNARLTVID